MKPETLEQLLEITRRMAETRVLGPLLRQAMAFALDLVNGEMGYLILLNPDQTFEFTVRLHRSGEDIDQPDEQVSHSILEDVLFEQRDVLLANAMQDADYQMASSVSSLRLRSVMCVPLMTQGKTLGALYLENRSQTSVFTRDDLKVLKFFAAQAAVAIENAMLNEDLEARVEARTAELRAANAQLEGNWQEAVEFNRIRSTFLTTIVHDIRSPLSTVVNTQELMLEDIFGELNEDQRQWTQTSLRTLRHVLKLTDDIFDLTKLEMGQLEIFAEPVDLNYFYAQVYDTGQILPWKSGVDFRLEVDDALPTIEIDMTRLQQVFINLLTNAAKFTEAGEVVLYAHQTDDGLRTGVRDTGVGIDPSEVEQIFERFKQGGTAMMRKQGTGLGLAISKELVRLHGGDLTVTSEPGVGSDFTFLL